MSRIIFEEHVRLMVCTPHPVVRNSPCRISVFVQGIIGSMASEEEGKSQCRLDQLSAGPGIREYPGSRGSRREVKRLLGFGLHPKFGLHRARAAGGG